MMVQPGMHGLDTYSARRSPIDSAFTDALDPAGRLVGTLDHATSPTEIAATIRATLSDGSTTTHTPI
jgi:hypothetical protein